MKISNSYPYPVLQNDNDDYIDSSFEVIFRVAPAFGELEIHVSFNLKNKGINDLIMSNNAAYVIHIECPQTSYRCAFESTDETIDITIPIKKLRGKVNLHSFILAKKYIQNYSNELLSDWYTETEINFEKGNFIAIGNAMEVILNEDNTDLLNLPSIVNIHKSLTNEFMEVDIHSSNIIITLPSYEYDQYAGSANSMLKNTILSMVIIPCLTEVFSKIKDNRDDLEEYTWFQVMEKIFKESNYRFEDVGTERLSALKAAQLVLRKPLKTSFKEIESLSNSEG